MSVSARSSAHWVTPVVIYLVAVVVYALLGTLQEIPAIWDELQYGHLARSVGDGEGLAWYGSSYKWTTALYIYLLAPSWMLASGESAYELAKLTSAIVACSVVFPVWALARRLTPTRRAVVPVALTVVGTWMLTTGGLLTENLAFPLSTAALISAVLALRDSDRRWAFAALGFAAAATLARAQMGVLFAILLAALLLDGAFAADRRARLLQLRTELIVLGVIVGAGVLIAWSGSTSTLGQYAGFSNFRPSVGDVALVTGKQWIALAAMCGFLPLAAWLAVAADLAAWRDRDLGPLLCVTTAAIVLLLLEAGYFGAGLRGAREWSIERYVAYAVPLLLVLLVVAIDRRRLRAKWLALAGAGVALTLLAAPELRAVTEQRAQYVTGNLGDALGLGLGPALALAGAVVVGAAAVVIARLDGRSAVYAIGGLLLVVLALQSQAAWRWQTDFTQQLRAQYPKNLSWVDASAKGPVSRIFIYQSSPLFQEADMFNASIEQDLAPTQRGPEYPPLGPTCAYGIDGRGMLLVQPGCSPVRRRIWNDDGFVQMSFHGGRVLARDPFLGQVIAVPENPRVRSVIRVPCQRVTLAGRNGVPVGIPKDVQCPPDMSVFLWVDSPGTLELTFQGGSRSQSVRFNDRTWSIPARERTTVRIPVRSQAANFTLATGWDRKVGTRLVDAQFVTRDERAPLL